MTTSIQHLKKVKLAILAGGEAGTYSLTPSPTVFEFLYGIGSDGLEPFESALCGKYSGESLALSLKADEAPAFFGRFLGPVRHLLGLHPMPPTLFLHVTVTAVEDAENREVVQALARSAGHGGCGGSCDCDCS